MNPNILLNRPAIRGNELRNGIEAFAHHVCSGLKLHQIAVEWHPGVSTAAINRHGRIFLSAVRDDALIRRADVLKYLGFVVHELLHRRYTDFSVNAHYTDPPDLAIYHNAIEDAWIERRAIKSGLLGNIESLLHGLLRGMTDKALAEVPDWAEPSVYPFALAVTCRAYPGITVPLAAGLAPIFSEASRRIDACTNSADTLAVARWVLDQLQNLPQQPEQQQPDNNPAPSDSANQDANQDAGNGAGKESKQDAAQGTDQQADKPGQQAGKPGQQGSGAPGSQPGPAKPATGRDGAREVEPQIDAPKDAGASGTFSRKASIRPPGAHLIPVLKQDIQPVTAPRLELEVRKLFEDSAQTLFTQNRKAGSINVSALGRFGTTDRLFKQRRDIEGIDSAVVILLDISGSMFHRPRRIRSALSTAALLIKVLNRAGVAVSVVTFGDDSSIAVPFNTPTAKALELIAQVRADGSTNDYAALKFSHDLLLARPESRKVCFVLTDGDGEKIAAREQVDSGTNLGITTIGIGMQLNVESVYPINLHVENLNSLATASLAKIKLAA